MIPVNEPLLNGNEKKYLNECIETGWISSDGPFVEKFEVAFAKTVQRKHGIAVCNGSAALDVAIQALNLPKGSEVILPSFTIISCATSISRNGLIPVPVDSDSKTWNMCPKLVEAAITPKTKAIMVVHIYGLPVDLDPILDLGKKFNLRIIEDAAEQIGQLYKGRPVGSFGDISTFSFYPNKHITTGEGGMVLTDNKNLSDRCHSIRNLCFVPEKRFIHYEIGHNFRMSNLQAAVGLAQLERLSEFVRIKRKIGSRYHMAFKEIKNFEFQPMQTSYAENIYWVFAICLKSEFPYDAAWFMKELLNLGIGTRPFFFPMHKQPVFLNMGLFSGLKLPVSEFICDRGFYIPSGLALTDQQAEEVIEKVLIVAQRAESSAR